MKISILIIFWGIWFLNFSARMILSPLLPIIEDELSITHTLAGGLFFYLSLSHTMSVLLSSFLALKFGYKRLIMTSVGILIAALILLKYADTYVSFAAISFFMGLGSGLYIPCAIPLLTSIIERSKWGKAIAFHETAASLNILAIPLLTALALEFLHWKNLFIILSGFCFIVAVFFWGYVPDNRPKKVEKFRYASIFRRKDFWIIAIMMMVSAMATAGLYNIMPLFLVKEKGLALQTANSIFGFSRIGGFLATIVIGIILDRYRVRSIFLVTLLMTAFSTIGIVFVQKFWLLMTMLIIQGTFSIASFPVGFVAISKITELNERAAYTGTIASFGVIFGMGVTPFLLGAVADAVNFQIGIFGLGLVTLISCFFIKGLREI